MKFQTIGPDKLNQLRHARMFKTADDLYNHMKKHADIIRPKFETFSVNLMRALKTRVLPIGLTRKAVTLLAFMCCRVALNALNSFVQMPVLF